MNRSGGGQVVGRPRLCLGEGLTLIPATEVFFAPAVARGPIEEYLKIRVRPSTKRIAAGLWSHQILQFITRVYRARALGKV